MVLVKEKGVRHDLQVLVKVRRYFHSLAIGKRAVRAHRKRAIYICLTPAPLPVAYTADLKLH